MREPPTAAEIEASRRRVRLMFEADAAARAGDYAQAAALARNAGYVGVADGYATRIEKVEVEEIEDG